MTNEKDSPVRGTHLNYLSSHRSSRGVIPSLPPPPRPPPHTRNADDTSRHLGGSAMDGSLPFASADRSSPLSSPQATSGGPQLPPALSASMVPRLFIQRVDIGALVVRATVQGYIPGKQVPASTLFVLY